MIDLPSVRALIERARADTLDGLNAREQLVTVAEQLVGEIEATHDPDTPQYGQWATRMRHPDGTEEITSPVSEWRAGMLATEYPAMHVALLKRTVTFGPWVEVPTETETKDA